MPMTLCPHCATEIPAYGSTCPHCGKGLAGSALLAEKSKHASMPASAMLFMVVAVLALVAGILNLSNATAGVGGIAVACLFAIFARIAQAAAYHRHGR